MALRPDQLGKPLKVTQRTQETPEAVSLTLAIPAELQDSFRYQAGQFVTFFLEIQGESLNRSYSLCTSPQIDREFKITVKKVPSGRASTYLCEKVKVGDILWTAPPAGTFFHSPTAVTPETHYILFAAGSGITPIFSILKTVLSASARHRVTLIYGNRHEDSIIYRQELERWSEQYKNRLEVRHVLSQASSAWNGRRGRVDARQVTEALQLTAKGMAQESYLCGPTEFMNSVRTALLTAGVPKDRIREEDFATSLHKPNVHVNAAWTLIGQDVPAESPEKIIALINGDTIEVAAKPDQNILETLIEAGAEPPYSCMDGACMACLAKIQEGRVYQEDPGILTDDNIAAGEALTCQAKPLSRIVKVSYDNL